MIVIVAGVVTTLVLLGQAVFFARKARYSQMRRFYTMLAILAFELAGAIVIIFVFIYALSTSKGY